MRPADAPKATDFAAIDTQLESNTGSSDAAGTLVEVIPSPRPAHVPVADKDEKTIAADPKTNDEKRLTAKKLDASQVKSTAELAEIYLKPIAQVRAQEKLSLGGATGPNPFGIKHTKGGRYIAPTPLPKTKPDT